MLARFSHKLTNVSRETFLFGSKKQHGLLFVNALFHVKLLEKKQCSLIKKQNNNKKQLFSAKICISRRSLIWNKVFCVCFTWNTPKLTFCNLSATSKNCTALLQRRFRWNIQLVSRETFCVFSLRCFEFLYFLLLKPQNN